MGVEKALNLLPIDVIGAVALKDRERVGPDVVYRADFSAKFLSHGKAAIYGAGYGETAGTPE